MMASGSCGAFWAAVGFTLWVPILTGCNSAPPPKLRYDYSQSLDRYYEGRPLCVWPDAVTFPVLNASPDQIRERGFNALADSGLLIRKHATKGAAPGSYTFDLTPEGRSALDVDVFDNSAGNFCYGRSKVTSIDSAEQNSRSTELVDYHYRVEEPAAWAMEQPIQRAFPQIASELAGPHKAQVCLLNTTDGWEIASVPTTFTPNAAAAHPPLLAKAKMLLAHDKRQGGLAANAGSE